LAPNLSGATLQNLMMLIPFYISQKGEAEKNKLKVEGNSGSG